MSEEMREVLAGVLGRLERIAEALESMHESQRAIRLNSDENLKLTAASVATMQELTALQVEAAKRNAGAMERAEQAYRDAINIAAGPMELAFTGAAPDPESGAAPGGGSDSAPGDEPTQSEAAARLGFCGSCGSVSGTKAGACLCCGAGLAPGASAN